MSLLAVALAAIAGIGGGTFDGRVLAPCDRTCVAHLVVVDDGRSLTSDSIVAAPCDFAETTTRDSRGAPRGTPIQPDGSFRWRTRFQVVEGTFAADRTVTGTARFLGRARGDCSAQTFHFGARLVRRAKSSARCEPLSGGRLAVSVFKRRTGCTPATRVVDAWRADRDCITSSLERRSCRVAGRSCTPVLGGRLTSLAGVACVSGRSRIELVLKQGCDGSGAGPGPGPEPVPGQGFAFGVTAAAINLRCSEALRVAGAWRQRSDCARHACSVAGYRCGRPAGSSDRTTCRRGQAGVELRRRPVIVD